MKLDGFGILVKDMPVMVRFYRDVLGFEIKEAEDTKNVFLEKDGTLFLMYGRQDFEKMAGQIFRCLKQQKAFQEVVAKGAEPIMEPTTEEWGQRTCYVADPEGNLVEIGSFQP